MADEKKKDGGKGALLATILAAPAALKGEAERLEAQGASPQEIYDHLKVWRHGDGTWRQEQFGPMTVAPPTGLQQASKWDPAGSVGRVDNLVSAPHIYDAVPNTRNLQAFAGTAPESAHTHGTFTPSGRLWVSDTAPNRLETAAHELYHAIDDNSGHPAGAAEAGPSDWWDQGRVRASAASRVGTANAGRVGTNAGNLTQPPSGRSFVDRLYQHYLDGYQKHLANGLDPQSASNQAFTDTENARYWNTTHEVGARLSAKRDMQWQKLHDEYGPDIATKVMQGSRPWEHEDVPRSDQFVATGRDAAHPAHELAARAPEPGSPRAKALTGPFDTMRDQEVYGRFPDAQAIGDGPMTGAHPTDYAMPIKGADGKPVGAFAFKVGQDYVQPTFPEIDPEHQGKGYGKQAYKDLVDWTHSTGRDFHADNSLSPQGQRMYPMLERMGYEVQENPVSKKAKLGGYLNQPNGEPLRVVPAPGSTFATTNFQTLPPQELASRAAPPTAFEAATAGSKPRLYARPDGTLGADPWTTPPEPQRPTGPLVGQRPAPPWGYEAAPDIPAPPRGIPTGPRIAQPMRDPWGPEPPYTPPPAPPAPEPPPSLTSRALGLLERSSPSARSMVAADVLNGAANHAQAVKDIQTLEASPLTRNDINAFAGERLKALPRNEWDNSWTGWAANKALGIQPAHQPNLEQYTADIQRLQKDALGNAVDPALIEADLNADTPKKVKTEKVAGHKDPMADPSPYDYMTMATTGQAPAQSPWGSQGPAMAAPAANVNPSAAVQSVQQRVQPMTPPPQVQQQAPQQQQNPYAQFQQNQNQGLLTKLLQLPNQINNITNGPGYGGNGTGQPNQSPQQYTQAPGLIQRMLGLVNQPQQFPQPQDINGSSQWGTGSPFPTSDYYGY